MFARPHAGVDNEFELSLIQLEESWEAVEVNSLKKLEETDAVLWILVEVFVDHGQGAFKYTLHDNRDLVLHKVL